MLTEEAAASSPVEEEPASSSPTFDETALGFEGEAALTPVASTLSDSTIEERVRNSLTLPLGAGTHDNGGYDNGKSKKNSNKSCTRGALARLASSITEDGDCMLSFGEDNNQPILLSSVVGISFKVYIPFSAPAKGQVVIVRRGRTLSRADWVCWATLVALSLGIYGVLFHLLGPITSGALLATIAHYRHEIREHLESTHRLPYALQVEWFSALGFYALFLLLIFKGALPLGWRAFFTATLIGGSLVFWLLPAVQRALNLSAWSIPSVLRPIQLDFPEGEIDAMLAERRRLLTLSPELREKVTKVCVGSYWVETVCSLLLYSEVYNSHKARKIGSAFFNYALPVVFAVQITAQNAPRLASWLGWLTASVRADFGVVVLKYLLATIDLLIDVRRIRAIDTIITSVHDITSYIGLWTAYVSSWLAPVDEAFTYIYAKFAPIQQLLSPIYNVFGRLVRSILELAQHLKAPMQQVLHLIVVAGKTLALYAERLRKLNVSSDKVEIDPKKQAREIASTLHKNVLSPRGGEQEQLLQKEETSGAPSSFGEEKQKKKGLVSSTALVAEGGEGGGGGGRKSEVGMSRRPASAGAGAAGQKVVVATKGKKKGEGPRRRPVART